MASNAFVRSVGPVGEVPGVELLGVELPDAAVVFSLPHALTASTSKARSAVHRLICCPLLHMVLPRVPASAVASSRPLLVSMQPARFCAASSRPLPSGVGLTVVPGMVNMWPLPETRPCAGTHLIASTNGLFE